jgi:hypothetical protein
MIKFEFTCFTRPHILCSLGLSFIESRQSHSTQNSGDPPTRIYFSQSQLGQATQTLEGLVETFQKRGCRLPADLPMELLRSVV